MNWKALWRALALVAMATAAMACSDDTPDDGAPDATDNPNNAPDMGDPDVGDPEDTDVPDEDVPDEDEEVVMCEPDAIIRCVVENTPAIEVCNFRGDQILQRACPGQSVCRTEDGQPECVEVACIPGDRVCVNEDLPAICDEDGSEYVNQEACGAGSICSNGACLDPCLIAEETRSYIGCEYWPVELENNLLYDDDETSTPDAPFAVVLANPQEEPASITVYTPEGDVMESVPEVFIPVGLIDPRFTSTTVYTQVLDPAGNAVGGPIEGLVENIEVPPGGQLQVLFPRRTPEPYISSLARIAWHVVSSRPVVAYQFNPICCNYSFTNDASILLPKGALTENYVAMSYPTWTPRTDFSSPATLTIVAVEDETEVTVRLRDPRIRPGEGVPEPDENGVITLTMDAQEVLNLATAESTPEVDVTGSVIEASKPVAVFGAHSCTNIPFTLAACDHVEQQLFPSETWGRNYVTSPLKVRGEGPPRTREATYWKLLAQDDNTTIILDRPYSELRAARGSAPPAAVPDCEDKLTRIDTIVLNANEFCEFGTNEGFSASADKPILIGAFMSGQFATGNEDFGNQAGDPAFFLMPPQEQFRSEYDFLTPATYALDFVTVVIPFGVPLTLDGMPIDPMEYDAHIIESQRAVVAHIPLDDGPHRMTAEAPFGIVVYAYDDFVSYAYTGGLNLAKINERE